MAWKTFSLPEPSYAPTFEENWLRSWVNSGSPEQCVLYVGNTKDNNSFYFVPPTTAAMLGNFLEDVEAKDCDEPNADAVRALIVQH